MTERVLAGSALLALVPLVWLLMLRGWRRQRDADLAAGDLPEPALPDVAEDAAPLGAEGVYVSTVRAGAPLQRVVAHGLGSRSSVVVATDEAGVSLHRGAARSVRIPATDLRGVRRERGQAGKVRPVVGGRGGLVVLRWRLGDADLDTAVALRHPAEADAVVADVERLVGAGR